MVTSFDEGPRWIRLLDNVAIEGSKPVIVGGKICSEAYRDT